VPHIKFIEATEQTKTNWGKFMVMKFDSEWEYKSAMDGGSFLSGRGWTPDHLFVMDMQTGEGAMFPVRKHGLASADLNTKHQIWVCILFEPFLSWLYQQDVSDISKLPSLVDLGSTVTGIYGYRRNRGGKAKTAK